MVQDEFLINERVRGFLNLLSSVLESPFVESELERIFADSDTDQVSQKSYSLYLSRQVSVTGVVGEYEPETIQIQLEGAPRLEKTFRRLIDDYYHPFDQRRPLH